MDYLEEISKNNFLLDELCEYVTNKKNTSINNTKYTFYAYGNYWEIILNNECIEIRENNNIEITSMNLVSSEYDIEEDDIISFFKYKNRNKVIDEIL